MSHAAPRLRALSLPLAAIVVCLALCGAGAADADQRLVPADAEGGELFGWSVAVSGDVLVVGAPRAGRHSSGFPENDDRGAAYVFRRDGLQWVEEAKLEGDAIEQHTFGDSVAIDGDRILVGGSSGGVAAQNPGAAYLFRREGEGWVREQRLAPGGEDLNLYFGFGVALRGDLAVVGALGDSQEANLAGSAFVYRYSGGSWILEDRLTASDAAAGDRFGRSVAIGERGVLAAAPGWCDESSRIGRVYLYRRVGGDWIEDQPILGSEAGPADCFGTALATWGDTLVVGSGLDDELGTDAGAAYVFVWDGQEWVEQELLRDADGGAHGGFGREVALRGRAALIGAPATHGGQAQFEPGAAHLFLRTDVGWVQSLRLAAPGETEFDRFGFGVALDRLAGIAGAPSTDRDGLPGNAGVAWVTAVPEPAGPAVVAAALVLIAVLRSTERPR